MEELYEESYKTLLKKLKVYLNKWMGKFNSLEM